MDYNTKVNRPTTDDAKDADVSRKLQIYGILKAFQAGKVPSNEQIDIALNSFLADKNIATPDNKLSDEGKNVIAKLRDVVKQSQHLLLSKNSGNLIQDFIWETEQFDGKAIDRPSGMDAEAAKKDGQTASEGLKTLANLIITNGQFRKLLKDSSILFRDMASDAAGNASNRFRPSDDELNQIDDPEEENKWHDTPDYGGMKAKANKMSFTGKKKAQKVAGSAANANDAQGAVGAVKAHANESVSEEDKAKAREKRDKYKADAREYMDKKLPKERRDNIVYRLKTMVIECQKNPDYMTAVKTLLNLAEQYEATGRSSLREGSQSAKQAHNGLDKAEKDLRILIERFANGTSTSTLWKAIGSLYDSADRDPELKGWFSSMNRFIRRCLLEEGYVLEDSSTEKWERLSTDAKKLFREKYRGQTDDILEEIKFLGKQFDEDTQNKAFAASLKSLFDTIGKDKSGKFAFKPSLAKDVTDVILPAILKDVSYIPLPRVEYSDEKIDMVIGNMIVESDNFMPNVFEIGSEHQFNWGRKFLSKKRNKQVGQIFFSGVQLDLPNVAYHIRRKSGLPKVTDTGLVDVLLPGDGFSARLNVGTPTENGPEKVFKVNDVFVDLKGLKLTFRKSDHKFLLGILKPIMLRVLRPILHKVADKVIRQQALEFDQLLWEVKQEAAATKHVEKNKENSSTPGLFARYGDAWKKVNYKREQRKPKKSDDSNSKVNVVWTMDESILPNVKLPASTVTDKATQFKQMAQNGDRWQSGVFSIGSAPASTNIPAAPHVRVKQRASMQSQSSANTGMADSAIGVGEPDSPHRAGGFVDVATPVIEQPAAEYAAESSGAHPHMSAAAPTFIPGTTTSAAGASNQNPMIHSSDRGSKFDSKTAALASAGVAGAGLAAGGAYMTKNKRESPQSEAHTSSTLGGTDGYRDASNVSLPGSEVPRDQKVGAAYQSQPGYYAGPEEGYSPHSDVRGPATAAALGAMGPAGTSGAHRSDRDAVPTGLSRGARDQDFSSPNMNNPGYSYASTEEPQGPTDRSGNYRLAGSAIAGGAVGAAGAAGVASATKSHRDTGATDYSRDSTTRGASSRAVGSDKTQLPSSQYDRAAERDTTYHNAGVGATDMGPSAYAPTDRDNDRYNSGHAQPRATGAYEDSYSRPYNTPERGSSSRALGVTGLTSAAVGAGAAGAAGMRGSSASATGSSAPKDNKSYKPGLSNSDEAAAARASKTAVNEPEPIKSLKPSMSKSEKTTASQAAKIAMGKDNSGSRPSSLAVASTSHNHSTAHTHLSTHTHPSHNSSSQPKSLTNAPIDVTHSDSTKNLPPARALDALDSPTIGGQGTPEEQEADRGRQTKSLLATGGAAVAAGGAAIAAGGVAAAAGGAALAAKLIGRKSETSPSPSVATNEPYSTPMAERSEVLGADPMIGENGQTIPSQTSRMLESVNVEEPMSGELSDVDEPGKSSHLSSSGLDAAGYPAPSHADATARDISDAHVAGFSGVSVAPLAIGVPAAAGVLNSSYEPTDAPETVDGSLQAANQANEAQRVPSMGQPDTTARKFQPYNPANDRMYTGNSGTLSSSYAKDNFDPTSSATYGSGGLLADDPPIDASPSHNLQDYQVDPRDMTMRNEPSPRGLGASELDQEHNVLPPPSSQASGNGALLASGGVAGDSGAVLGSGALLGAAGYVAHQAGLRQPSQDTDLERGEGEGVHDFEQRKTDSPPIGTLDEASRSAPSVVAPEAVEAETAASDALNAGYIPLNGSTRAAPITSDANVSTVATMGSASSNDPSSPRLRRDSRGIQDTHRRPSQSNHQRVPGAFYGSDDEDGLPASVGSVYSNDSNPNISATSGENESFYNEQQGTATGQTTDKLDEMLSRESRDFPSQSTRDNLHGSEAMGGPVAGALAGAGLAAAAVPSMTGHNSSSARSPSEQADSDYTTIHPIPMSPIGMAQSTDQANAAAVPLPGSSERAQAPGVSTDPDLVEEEIVLAPYPTQKSYLADLSSSSDNGGYGYARVTVPSQVLSYDSAYGSENTRSGLGNSTGQFNTTGLHSPEDTPESSPVDAPEGWGNKSYTTDSGSGVRDEEGFVPRSVLPPGMIMGKRNFGLSEPTEKSKSGATSELSPPASPTNATAPANSPGSTQFFPNPSRKDLGKRGSIADIVHSPIPNAQTRLEDARARLDATLGRGDE